MSLDLWRSSLPDMMKWKDSDPSATKVNAARMRSKFYGTRCIIDRPLLLSCLHNDQLVPKSACRICIGSAILNTTAFDGIEGRLVLNNIFGTAHS